MNNRREETQYNYTFIRIVCQREKCPISTRVIVLINVKINSAKNTFGMPTSDFLPQTDFSGLYDDYL